MFMTADRVPFRPLPWQPIDGEVDFPVAVPYCVDLHCKNAAISVPANLNRNSQGDVWRIQIIATAVKHSSRVFNGICVIALAPLSGRR